MSTNGDDREAGADASSIPADIVPACEIEDNASATTTNPTMPNKNSTSPQIIPQSTAVQYPPASSYPNHPNHNNNHNHNQTSTFMRQPNGYYAYQSNTPNSPAPGYDTASQALLLQHLGPTPDPLAHRQRQHRQFRGPPPPPLSPTPRNDNNAGEVTADDAQISLGVLAPSSPTFPGAGPMGLVGGVNGVEHRRNVDSAGMGMQGASSIAPPSPSVHFLPGHPQSPVVSGYAGVGVYSGYIAGSPGVGYGSPSPSNDSRLAGWPDRVHQSIYQTAPQSANSPHVQSQPMPMQFQTTGRRTTSFDEMLPGPAMDDNSSLGAGTVFSQQWGVQGYNLNSPYTTAPQQPQIQGHHPPQPGAHRALAGRHGGSPLQGAPGTAGFYPATTPGPPIQTTHHNKGPDGANLFIFHIPNHFTNLDMWHLFCHYGNLLSVRIMVEKDSGRSRGFGFVSYDSSDAAAMAIKELNGFVIGNKRLKVQHKQIKPSHNNNSHHASQQDNMQSPPLFPNMVSNGHDSTTTGDLEDENGGMIIGHNWMDEHAAHGEMNEPVELHGGQQQHQQHQQQQPTLAVELAVVSEIDPQNNGGQSNNNNHNNNGNNRDGRYDDQALANMEQMRNALPDVSK